MTNWICLVLWLSLILLDKNCDPHSLFRGTSSFVSLLHLWGFSSRTWLFVANTKSHILRSPLRMSRARCRMTSINIALGPTRSLEQNPRRYAFGETTIAESSDSHTMLTTIYPHRRLGDLTRLILYHSLEVDRSLILNLWSFASGLGLSGFMGACTWLILVALHHIALWKKLDSRIAACKGTDD